MRRRVLLSLLSGTAATLAGCADGAEEPTPAEDGGSATPETPEATETTPAPQPTVSVEAPARSRRGDPFSVRFTAENPADEPQTVSRQVYDATADRPVEDVSRTLEPGETVTWGSQPVIYETIPDDGVVELDIGEDSLSVRIFEPVAVRSSHTYDDGVTLHVGGIRSVQAYPHRIDGERRWRHADDGSKYVLLFVAVTGLGDGEPFGSSPSERGISLRYGEQVFRPRTPRYSPRTGVSVPSRYTIASRGSIPRTDVPAYDSVDIRRSAMDGSHPDENLYPDAAAAPGETLWLMYTVPSGVPLAELRVLASR